jgi:chromosomal replication initiation ATPase DnaA
VWQQILSRQFRLKLERREAFRRADFVASPANADARTALDSWPAWHGGCLALVGPAGAGKSHLAQTWAKSVGATILSGAAAVDLRALEGGPVVLEDADREASDEDLFHLINMAGADGGGLLLTARTPPSQWPAKVPDLRSRLNAMQVAELEEPDEAILTAVFDKFFRERNIRPAEDLVPYLLNRIERSVPEALKIVTLLDEAADAHGRAVSKTLARQILDAESLDTEPPGS